MSISQDTSESESRAGVPWEPWTADAFGRAARERKPVLLSIVASWCHGCGVMDRTTYSTPALVEAIAASTVPVRVDADRRFEVFASQPLRCARHRRFRKLNSAD